MTLQSRILAFTCVLLTTPLVLSAQNAGLTANSAETRAAEAAFPQDLRYPGKPPSENPYHSCSAVLSRKADGTPDLIAAGYSGDGAKVGILASTPNGDKIISPIADQPLLPTDGECELQMVSLADPEHSDSPLAKTIQATFDGGPDWFFTWDGKKLQNITALDAQMDYWMGKEARNSNMYSTNVVDIDHRGPMQIVADNGDWDKFPGDDGIAATGAVTLFRYNGSAFVPAKTLIEIEEFEPNFPKTSDQLAEYKTDAAQWTRAINMHQTPASSYRLTIINGDRGGRNRVTSAKVEINGALVVSSSEVSKGVETLTRTVQLHKENTIKVTIDGPERSYVYVTIE
jgi:hypothetical protein